MPKRTLAEHAAGFARPAEGDTALREANRPAGFTWQTEGGAIFVEFGPIVGKRYDPAAMDAAHQVLLGHAQTPETVLPDGMTFIAA